MPWLVWVLNSTIRQNELSLIEDLTARNSIPTGRRPKETSTKWLPGAGDSDVDWLKVNVGCDLGQVGMRHFI